MASLTTSLALATATALLALTTPFVPPPACTPFSRTTSRESIESGSAYQTTSTTTIVFEDPTDERFITCQPSGWDRVKTSLRFTFSPAVCPESWLAYSVRTSGPSTLAECCRSGYVPQYVNLSLITSACWSRSMELGEPFVTTSSTYTFMTTETLYLTDFVHPAWHIEWEKKDQSRLTPQPPSMTSDMFIPTWTPGSVIDGKAYESPYFYRPVNDSGLSGFSSLPVLIGCVTGIPVFFMSLCCCCCCCYSCKKKRRRKRAEAANLEEAADGQETEMETRNSRAADRPSADERLPPYTASSPDPQGDPPAYIDRQRLSQTLARP